MYLRRNRGHVEKNNQQNKGESKSLNSEMKDPGEDDNDLDSEMD